jgi:leucyl aminopeptidase
MRSRMCVRPRLLRDKGTEMANPTINLYDPIPSTRRDVRISARSTPPTIDEECALAVPVAQDAEPVRELGFDAAALRSAGFRGTRGQTLVLPGRDGILRVAVGVGAPAKVDRTRVRKAAAEFARAVPQHKCLVVELPASDLGISTADYAQAVTEGVFLARWRFTVAADPEPTLESLILVGPAEDLPAAEEGARRGQAIAEAYNIGRDLANCPAATLTAARMAELATELGARAGFEVEVFDKDQLIEMGWAAGGSSASTWAASIRRASSGCATYRRPRRGGWRSSARGSCTTRVASASSPVTSRTRR